MKKILILLLVLTHGFCLSQNYQNIDSIVEKYPKNFKSIETLASWINLDFDSDIDKVRAAYYWLVNNIEYYSDSVVIKPSFDIYFSEYQRTRHEKQKNKKRIEDAFSTKKANCLGYALSLKLLCDAFNVESEIIKGIAKCDVNDINVDLKIKNHAWNAVKLNDKWHLIDISWATGFDFNIEEAVNTINHYILFYRSR